MAAALLISACPALGAEPYVAPAWLPGGHLQALYAVVLPRPHIPYRRERWELPDGDFIDLD